MSTLFKNCICNPKLPFDFWLSTYNLLIEFQGKQHYEVVEYFGGEKTFEESQYRDNIKVKWCKDNNIFLLIILYWEKDNIAHILLDHIKI